MAISAGGGAADFVFTDHRMPGSMTGSQLAGWIRRRYPLLGVIVTSGYFNDREWEEPILPKPYDLLKTAAALAELAIDGKQKEENS